MVHRRRRIVHPTHTTGKAGRRKRMTVKAFSHKRYRIVTDRYCGYEAQVWRWWFPFWVQMSFLGPINTFKSIEDARKFIHSSENAVVWRSWLNEEGETK
jgi:hypothetical protein